MNTFTKNNVTFNFEQDLETLVGKYTIQDYLDRWQTKTTDPLALATEFLTFVDAQRQMLGRSFEEALVKKIIDAFAHNPRLRITQGDLPTEPYQWETHFSYDRLVRALSYNKAESYDPTDLLTFLFRDMIAAWVDLSIYNDLTRMSVYSPRVLDALNKHGLDLVLTTSTDTFELFNFEIETDRAKIVGTYAGLTAINDPFSIDVYEK